MDPLNLPILKAEPPVSPAAQRIGSFATAHGLEAGLVVGTAIIDPAQTAMPQTYQPSPAANQTIKLPVPTTVLPAIAIGVFIVLLLLAVAAYAFI